jgi:hypothetical protein
LEAEQNRPKLRVVSVDYEPRCVGYKLAIVRAEGGTVAHTKLFATVAAAALAPTAGASSAAAYSPEHPNTTAVENCDANVAKQFDRG